MGRMGHTHSRPGCAPPPPCDSPRHPLLMALPPPPHTLAAVTQTLLGWCPPPPTPGPSLPLAWGRDGAACRSPRTLVMAAGVGSTAEALQPLQAGSPSPWPS